jgi:hypothetical protein
MRNTRFARVMRAQNAVAEQRRWIEQCGGTLSGYIRNYGAADDPDRHGDGGRAIWEADVEALHRAEQALARVRGDA